MKFKAAILNKSKSDLIVDDIILNNSLETGQILVKLNYSGLCRSQINEIDALKGKDKFLPHLLGHEGSGTIVDMKTTRNDLNKGDNVILHWMKGKGIESATPKYKWGRRNLNAGWVTTFNEYAVVSENRITPFSTNKISKKVASLFGCCLTTGFGTINNYSKVKIGDEILIIGLGGVGLNLVLGANIVGANRVYGVEREQFNLNLAKKYGLFKGYRDIKKINKKFDKVIDTTGNVNLIEKGYECTSDKGIFTMIGIPEKNKRPRFKTLPLHFNKTINGSHGGFINPSEDINKYINIINTKKINLEKQIGRAYSLENINVALKDFRKKSNGRIQIKFK